MADIQVDDGIVKILNLEIPATSGLRRYSLLTPKHVGQKSPVERSRSALGILKAVKQARAFWSAIGFDRRWLVRIESLSSYCRSEGV